MNLLLWDSLSCQGWTLLSKVCSCRNWCEIFVILCRLENEEFVSDDLEPEENVCWPVFGGKYDLIFIFYTIRKIYQHRMEYMKIVISMEENFQLIMKLPVEHPPELIVGDDVDNWWRKELFDWMILCPNWYDWRIVRGATCSTDKCMLCTELWEFKERILTLRCSSAGELCCTRFPLLISSLFNSPSFFSLISYTISKENLLFARKKKH